MAFRSRAGLWSAPMPLDPPDPASRFGALSCLLPLTGRWRVESDQVAGEASFAWSPGRRFLVQVFDFRRDGRWLDGIEFIGWSGGTITSRAFHFRDGEIRDHVWRLEGGELTVGGVAPDAGPFMTARFDADGARFAGEWVWSEDRRPFQAFRIDLP